jgi:hypothetical protein
MVSGHYLPYQMFHAVGVKATTPGGRVGQFCCSPVGHAEHDWRREQPAEAAALLLSHKQPPVVVGPGAPRVGCCGRSAAAAPGYTVGCAWVWRSS